MCLAQTITSISCSISTTVLPLHYHHHHPLGNIQSLGRKSARKRRKQAGVSEEEEAEYFSIWKFQEGSKELCTIDDLYLGPCRLA